MARDHKEVGVEVDRREEAQDRTRNSTLDNSTFRVTRHAHVHTVVGVGHHNPRSSNCITSLIQDES
uniref:Uncharacterized protein n=1 Tax=Timema poppense TaxID=170557 RepID=A0A7R9H5J5_TIMPO|nr:unnamed protein product [Timema poppensis]